ncbi:thiamine phosphate synthase [Helicobacter sp.]|uniref:thiamine phosphate synthase n=1 Tax=Helicobacter sp. TaxID=218 RepID=UPI0019A644BB|nr:thiamine phosphate synthase [Helicobacter sp.]MBD5164930.1 thiamine phosphate synthase [Helicobacter sp.]
MLRGIYAISDTSLTPKQTLKQSLQAAICGGIGLFQLRDKESSDEEIAALCGSLEQLCKANNVVFVLNDRVELAIRLKVQALHIGKKDDDTPYSLEELKHIRTHYHGILGVSCYGSLELAKSAKEAGADYVAFGACFCSPTKPQAKRIDLNLFECFNALEDSIPTCAIGGINAENIAQLKNAQMVACISSIWQGDIQQNIKNLIKNWHS